MKKILQTIVIITLLMTMSTTVFAAEPKTTQQTDSAIEKTQVAEETTEPTSFASINVIFNEETNDNLGFEKDGIPYIYIPDFYQMLGSNVVIGNDGGKVVASMPSGNVVFNVGSQTAKVYGVDTELSVPVEMVNGKAVLPANDIAALMNYKITWDAETKTASIFTEDYVPTQQVDISTTPEPEPIETTAPAEDVVMTPITVNYNGQDFVDMGYEKDGTSYIYVQFFYEMLEAPSVILEEDGSVVVGYPEGTMEFRPNSQTAMVFGEEMPFSEMMYLVDDKLAVPARDIAKTMNYTISWNGESKTVSLKTPEYIEITNVEFPYYIYVDKSDFLVTIYEIDENGEYATVVKEMKTATGKTDNQTPVGKFSIAGKEEWHEWSNGYFTKYSTEYAPGLYFHSPLYKGADDNNIVQSSIDEIGTKATSGCLKVTTEDAKWIYDNCPIGTVVEIVK